MRAVAARELAPHKNACARRSVPELVPDRARNFRLWHRSGRNMLLEQQTDRRRCSGYRPTHLGPSRQARLCTDRPVRRDLSPLDFQRPVACAAIAHGVAVPMAVPDVVAVVDREAASFFEELGRGWHRVFNVLRGAGCGGTDLHGSFALSAGAEHRNHVLRSKNEVRGTFTVKVGVVPRSLGFGPGRRAWFSVSVSVRRTASGHGGHGDGARAACDELGVSSFVRVRHKLSFPPPVAGACSLFRRLVGWTHFNFAHQRF